MSVPKLNARVLIVDLLTASSGNPVSIKQMVLAAQLFNLSDNSIRVAVARLCHDGLIEAAGRGVYQLTGESREWARSMLQRQTGLKSTRHWQQEYLAVYTVALGRVDRTALKRRERALRHYGFRELDTGWYVRPDNLIESFEQTHEKLKSAGLEAQAMMLKINTFDQETVEKIAGLWKPEQLNQAYQHGIHDIGQWLAQADQLSTEDAARESLLLGKRFIPLLVNDPLLPEPFVDVALRQQFMDKVYQLDQLGQDLWQQLYQHVPLLEE